MRLDHYSRGEQRAKRVAPPLVIQEQRLPAKQEIPRVARTELAQHRQRVRLGCDGPELGFGPFRFAAILEADDVAPKTSPSFHLSRDYRRPALTGVHRVARAKLMRLQNALLGGDENRAARPR